MSTTTGKAYQCNNITELLMLYIVNIVLDEHYMWLRLSNILLLKNVFSFNGLECSMELWMHLQSRGKNISESDSRFLNGLSSAP